MRHHNAHVLPDVYDGLRLTDCRRVAFRSRQDAVRDARAHRTRQRACTFCWAGEIFGAYRCDRPGVRHWHVRHAPPAEVVDVADPNGVCPKVAHLTFESAEALKGEHRPAPGACRECDEGQTLQIYPCREPGVRHFHLGHDWPVEREVGA